jgi:hypothetical protein
MEPVRIDFDGKQGSVCPQGADFAPVLRFLQSDGRTPVDFTGYAAALQVRDAFDSPVPRLSLTSAAGQILFTGDGRIALAVPATLTATLPVPEAAGSNKQPASHTYVYDLLLTAAGATFRRCYGLFVVLARVTA